MNTQNQTFILDFFKLESAGGILLFCAALLAIFAANSPLHGYYDLFLAIPVEVRVGPLEIAKPLLLWINDGLMAVFFFLVGLELKRELLEGELADKRNIILPGVGRYRRHGNTGIDLRIFLYQRPCCRARLGNSSRDRYRFLLWAFCHY